MEHRRRCQDCGGGMYMNAERSAADSRRIRGGVRSVRVPPPLSQILQQSVARGGALLELLMMPSQEPQAEGEKETLRGHCSHQLALAPFELRLETDLRRRKGYSVISNLSENIRTFVFDYRCINGTYIFGQSDKQLQMRTRRLSVSHSNTFRGVVY